MKTIIKITVEVELEEIIDISDEEQKLWLENEILVGDSTLHLHSEDIGDFIGTVKKVKSIQYIKPKPNTNI